MLRTATLLPPLTTISCMRCIDHFIRRLISRPLIVSEDRRRLTWYRKSRSSVVCMSIDGRYPRSTSRQSSILDEGFMTTAPKASLWIGGRVSRPSHLVANCTKGVSASVNSGSAECTCPGRSNSCLTSSRFSSAIMSNSAPSNTPFSCTTPFRGSSTTLSGGAPVIAFHQSRASPAGLPESGKADRRSCSVCQGGGAGCVVSVLTGGTPYANVVGVSRRSSYAAVDVEAVGGLPALNAATPVRFWHRAGRARG